MLKNKNFKIKRLGDYNNVIITREMNWKDLKVYSIENRDNFNSLRNRLFISIGKKIQDIITFDKGTEIIDAERTDKGEKIDYYGDIQVIDIQEEAFSIYSEFNAPICTKINNESEIIISLTNNLGYKLISKLELMKIDKLKEVIEKLQYKKSEISVCLYCNRELTLTTREILKFKEKLKKMEIKEEGLINYDIDREYIVNIPKLLCDILYKYEIDNIKIIKYMEEDTNNLLLFV